MTAAKSSGGAVASEKSAASAPAGRTRTVSPISGASMVASSPSIRIVLASVRERLISIVARPPLVSSPSTTQFDSIRAAESLAKVKSA